MAKLGKFTQIIKEYGDFQKLSLEEIQNNMKDVIHKHGARAVSEGTGLSIHALYRYCKELFLYKGSRPDFIAYCSVMSFGELKGRVSDGK